jgi:hypothetical protein
MRAFSPNLGSAMAIYEQLAGVAGREHDIKGGYLQLECGSNLQGVLLND